MTVKKGWVMKAEHKKYVTEAIKKNPGLSNSKIVNRLKKGVREHVTAAMVGKARESMGSQPVAPVVSKGTAKGLAEFRNLYDKDTIVPSKIKAALSSLGAAWEYEVEFIRRDGISTSDMGNYRDQFDEYWTTVKRDSKRVWAGTPSFAAKIKEMV